MKTAAQKDSPSSDSKIGTSGQAQKPVAIVTGANSGIGKASAIALASQGIHVAALCRSEQRGKQAVADIKAASGGDVTLFVGDLSDFDSINQFVTDYKKKFDRLDILIHNAGLLAKNRHENKDGIEMNLAVHHLGPFLMNQLLMPTILQTRGSRIVIVTSMAHAMGKLDFDDLQLNNSYKTMGAYSRSKLCNLLYMQELDRRLEGTGTTVNCVHPGAVATNISAGDRDLGVSIKKLNIFQKIASKFIKTPEQGAATIVYVATSKDTANISGKYWANMKIHKTRAITHDRALADQLWQVSEDLIAPYLDQSTSE